MGNEQSIEGTAPLVNQLADDIVSAFKEGNHEKVAELIRSDDTLIFKRSIHGELILHWACASADLATVQLVIDSG